MKSISLPYGTTTREFNLPDILDTHVYSPNHLSPLTDPQLAVLNALQNFVDGSSIQKYSQSNRVVIAINDNTRPVPNDVILPPLLAELLKLGIVDHQITFLIATGTHKPLQGAEIEQVMPVELARRFQVISHNCDDLDNLVSLGKTKAGTPVLINRQFMEADLRILIGNIEPHHFMGFSGGVKTAGIGLAGRETINANHAMLLLPGAAIGQYEGNPIRADLEEMGMMIGDMLAVNVVLNADRNVVAAFAGDPLAVIQAGMPVARQVCQTMIEGRYDLVIASAGGYPKDINLYQAQKALTHASLMTRDSGCVILVAACADGVGSQGYLDFMEGVTTFAQVFEKFQRQGFRVGPHKAVQIARDATRIKVIILSELPENTVKQLLLYPASSPEHALEIAYDHVGAQPRVALLPKATSTIPMVRSV